MPDVCCLPSNLSLKFIVYYCLFSVGKGHKRNWSDESVLITISMKEAEGGAAPPPPDGAVAKTPPRTRRHFVPVTPQVVGEVMSLDDPYYTPHTDNPFTSKFKDGNTKLIGSLCENWSSWFDYPSPCHPSTPPCTPITSDELQFFRMPSTARSSRSHSLPGSPSTSLRNLHCDTAAGAVYSSHTLRTFSALNSWRRLEPDGLDDSFDGRSEGSSSTDSALELDLMIRDFCTTSSRYSHRRYSSRGGRFGRDSSLMSRLESRLLDDSQHHLVADMARLTDDDCLPHSYSSSDSCVSFDDCSLLSPTGSYSSYGDTEMSHRHTCTRHEFFEFRLRSRERFQELIERWESKQSHTVLGSKQSRTVLGSGDSRQSHTVLGSSHSKQSHTALGSGDKDDGCSWQSNRTWYLSKWDHPDAYVEQRFQELRRKWEARLLSSAATEAAKGDANCGQKLTTAANLKASLPQ